jgi:cytochrome oxidase assembly protein ShyY1
MTRMLLTPRWLGRLGVLLLVIAACVLLGRWQWDVAHTTVTRTPPSGTAALTEAHAVGQPVDTEQAGQRVWLRGTFDPDRQVLVVDRPRDGAAGTWVVTAMTVDGADPAGAVIPVVRGWLPAGERPPDSPRGQQRVEGWLEPSEPDTLREVGRGLATGEVELISSPELLSLWRPPLYQGFVIQDSPDPAAPLVLVPRPADVTSTTDWQNFAYAIQWWLFAAFAVFWFIRMMRVEAEDDSVAASAAGTPEGPEVHQSVDRMDQSVDHDHRDPRAERQQREHQ